MKQKINLLYMSKGKFDSRQAATLINAIGPMSHRPEVIQILAPRLCQMTCADAREILLAVNVNSDHRLNALNHIKRYLSDNQTALGREYILSVFPYETSKRKALQILSTVSSYPETAYSSGGHQIHAPLGTVLSQAVPLKEYYYGPVSEQIAKANSPPHDDVSPRLPGRDLPNLAHSSYVYTEDRTYTPRNSMVSRHLDSAPKYNETAIAEILGSGKGLPMTFQNIQRNVYPIGANYIC